MTCTPSWKGPTCAETSGGHGYVSTLTPAAQRDGTLACTSRTTRHGCGTSSAFSSRVPYVPAHGVSRFADDTDKSPGPEQERGFGGMRDANGGDIFFHRTAMTPPESVTTLEVGRGIEFEPESGPKSPAPRRSASRLLRRLRYCRVTSWQPTSEGTPPAKSMT